MRGFLSILVLLAAMLARATTRDSRTYGSRNLARSTGRVSRARPSRA